MRKPTTLAATVATLAIAIALAGCNAAPQSNDEPTNQANQEPQQQQSTEAPAKDASPDEILDAITADFETTEKTITDGLSTTKTGVGDSFDSYVANKAKVTDWMDATQTATDDLFARTTENSKQYFETIAKQAQNNGDADLDKQMKAWYRAVYEDAFKDYFDAVYEDAYKELFDTYYDGILKDAFDSAGYDEVSAEHSAFYRAYSDGTKNIYRSYSDATSDEYRMYSDVSSAFFKENYDLSDILPK